MGRTLAFVFSAGQVAHFHPEPIVLPDAVELPQPETAESVTLSR